MNDDQQVYQQAAAYDLAFSYRDYPAEWAFIEAAVEKLGKTAPDSVLELAAGPARHALTAAKRGLRAQALDRAPEMASYARHLATTARLPLSYAIADMRDFSLADPAPFALALLMLDSVSHLLTQADFLQHLSAVGQHVCSGGVYLLECSHPRDLLTPQSSVETDWETEDGQQRVRMQWGQAEDAFDPITQIRQVSVRLRRETPAGIDVFRECVPQRSYTYPELLALIALQGDFRLAASYGGFELGISLSDARAWRMLLLLERI